MAFSITWSPRSLRQIQEISEYIGKDSIFYAELFVKNVFQNMESVALFPKIGRIVPEYKNELIRERFYGNYRIVYRIKKNQIEVLIVTHGTRLLKNS
jgi:plasmid stabilization system protein ParE